MSANDKTIKRIRKILESQLELLATKGADQISHSELGGIARTLFDVIKREEAAFAEKAEPSTPEEEQNSLMETMTADEIERLGMLYDVIEAINDGARKRIGQSRPAWLAPTRNSSPLQHFRYLLAICRDEPFMQVVEDFIKEKGLESKFERELLPILEGVLSEHMSGFFVQAGCFDEITERTATVLGPSTTE